jgi:hypothetical protein
MCRNKRPYPLNSRLGGCCSWPGHFRESFALTGVQNFSFNEKLCTCDKVFKYRIEIMLGHFSASHMGSYLRANGVYGVRAYMKFV